MKRLLIVKPILGIGAEVAYAALIMAACYALCVLFSLGL
jgi:hypothetical protein